MKFTAAIIAAAGALYASTGAAQSSNTSICDKYSMALFNSTNGTTQATLLTALVNTALIGNYSPLGGKHNVTGILANGTYNGTQVSLLKYFDGSLKSTNVNNNATAVNFLDGGGAAPLKQNKAANDDSSRQYTLVTHLYEYFGKALGCSSQSSDDNAAFKNYQGSTSMSSVHRFMNLNQIENDYFIQEVGNAALSFGVSTADATAVGQTLNMLFNYRCAPAISFPPGSQNASQSICLASTCPLYPQGYNCTAAPQLNSYPNGTDGTAAQLASGQNAPEDPTTGAASSAAAANSKTATAVAAGSTGSSGSKGGSNAGAVNVPWVQSAAVFGALAMGAVGVLTVL